MRVCAAPGYRDVRIAPLHRGIIGRSGFITPIYNNVGYEFWDLSYLIKHGILYPVLS